MIWLAHGLVVPWFHTTGKVVKVNIRRLDWHAQDERGKYVKISGGSNAPAIYGNPSLPIGIILESEFDALLIQQEAGDIVFCIANSGSTQQLDLYTDYLIRKTPLILFAPDVDAGSAKFLNQLEARCKKGVLWPAPIGKSPGDALIKGVNLREWVLAGTPTLLRKTT